MPFSDHSETRPTIQYNKDRPVVSYPDHIDVEGYLNQRAVADNEAVVTKALENLHESKVLETGAAPEAAPVAPQPAQVSNPYNMEDISKMFGGFDMPEIKAPTASRGPSSMEELLVGATPLLVDLLTGGNKGQDIAANYFLKAATPGPDKDKKNAELQIQQMKLLGEKIKAAKHFAGNGAKGSKPLSKSNFGQFVDRNGKRVSGTYDMAVAN